MFRFKKDGPNGYRVLRAGVDLGRIYRAYRLRAAMWRISSQDWPGQGYWSCFSTRDRAAEALAGYVDAKAVRS